MFGSAGMVTLLLYFGITQKITLLIIIGCIFSLFPFILSYYTSCGSMTIDKNRGIVSVKKGKIYYCKKQTYNISEIEEVVLRMNPDWGYYNDHGVFDIILYFAGGRRVVGASKIEENGESVNIYNMLRIILPEHIKVTNEANPTLFD